MNRNCIRQASHLFLYIISHNMYNRVKHYWTFVLTIIIINSRKINSTHQRRCSHLMGGKRRYETPMKRMNTTTNLFNFLFFYFCFYIEHFIGIRLTACLTFNAKFCIISDLLFFECKVKSFTDNVMQCNAMHFNLICKATRCFSVLYLNLQKPPMKQRK